MVHQVIALGLAIDWPPLSQGSGQGNLMPRYRLQSGLQTEVNDFPPLP